MDQTENDIRSKINNFERAEDQIRGVCILVFLTVAFIACIICGFTIEDTPKSISRMTNSTIILSVALAVTLILLLVSLKRMRSLRFYTLAVYDKFAFGLNAGAQDSTIATQYEQNRMTLSILLKVKESLDSISRNQVKLIQSVGSVKNYKQIKDRELSSVFYILTRSIICPDDESLHNLVDVCNMDLSALDLSEDIIKHLKKRSIRTVKDVIFGRKSLLRYEEAVHNALMKKHQAFELFMHYPDLMKDVLRALSRTDSYIHEHQLYPSEN